MSIVCYQASGATGTRSAYGATPRAAARLFLERNPRARKTSVTEGRDDNGHFVIVYGRAADNQWPDSWRDVPRSAVNTLPDCARTLGGESLIAKGAA